MEQAAPHQAGDVQDMLLEFGGRADHVIARRTIPKTQAPGAAVRGLKDDRVLAIRRQKGKGAVGSLVLPVVSIPGCGIPAGDSYQKIPQGRVVQGSGLAHRRFLAAQATAVQLGDQAQGDAANLEIEIADLVIAQSTSPEDEIGSLAHPVDRVDARVQALEKVRHIDVSALPAALKVEVVDRCVAEVERESPFLEAGEEQVCRS